MLPIPGYEQSPNNWCGVCHGINSGQELQRVHEERNQAYDTNEEVEVDMEGMDQADEEDMDGDGDQLDGAEQEIVRGRGWITRSIPSTPHPDRQEIKDKARGSDNGNVGGKGQIGPGKLGRFGMTPDSYTDGDGEGDQLEGAEQEIDRGMGWISRSIPSILHPGRQRTQYTARGRDNGHLAN